ncbi:Ser/Thr protein phosphatase [Bacillus cereus Rock3-29]|nr:Ser/Thr protein phosphatase [Bacillus cereus Rock3-29]
MKWLHLSDIHYLYRNYETDVMRDTFITYIADNFKDTIDILFITGDFAHQGSDYTAGLFGFLENIVRSLNIEKTNIFIIPGNHDVKRNELMGLAIDSIINNENARKRINELGDDTFRSLYSGQEAFIEFYENFLEREYPKDDFHFLIQHKEMNILHINTCLVAGADNVEGKILVGLDKLYATLKDLDKSKITFALGHHTLSCLHKDEIETFKNRLSDSFIDFYLCGHVHKTNLSALLDNFNATHVFTCGANVVDGYSDSVFIEGELDEVCATAKVKYHKWHQEREFWYIDNSLDRKLKNGYFECQIDKLKKKRNP